MNIIRKDTHYTCCTPIISPNPIIMYQLKPFKQYAFYRNQKLDDYNNVFSITLPSLRSNKNYPNLIINFVTN